MITFCFKQFSTARL